MLVCLGVFWSHSRANGCVSRSADVAQQLKSSATGVLRDLDLEDDVGQLFGAQSATEAFSAADAMLAKVQGMVGQRVSKVSTGSLRRARVPTKEECGQFSSA